MRQILEKCKELGLELLIIFVDKQRDEKGDELLRILLTFTLEDVIRNCELRGKIAQTLMQVMVYIMTLFSWQKNKKIFSKKYK